MTRGTILPDPSDPSFEIEPSSSASGLAAWRIAEMTGALPTGVSFRLERRDGTAKIQILVRQRGEGPCLQSTPLGDVSYRRMAGLTDAEAAEVTRAFAKALEGGSLPLTRYFPHLASEASIGNEQDRRRLAQVIQPAIALLGDQRQDLAQLPDRLAPATLVFDPPGIAEFFAPELTVDGPPMLGWSFRGIYLPSVARRHGTDFSAYMLEFARQDREQTLQLALRVDGDDSRAFGRCGRLSLGIVHEGEPDAVPAERASLASWVVALLRLKSPAGLEVRVPRSMAELRAISYPPRPDTPDASRHDDTTGTRAEVADLGPPPPLTLALESDCGQRCVFCSVKSLVTPSDAGSLDLSALQAELDQAYQNGVREIRLNGIDPLQHSRVLDLLDCIRAVGFPALSVFSTGRRLADLAFRAEFLRRVPAQVSLFVPLYGVSAATHDAVTGTPGSHRDVLAAIAGLRAAAAAAALRIGTVVVERNVHEIVPLLGWLREAGLAAQIDVHLPYPMGPMAPDRYFESALRETDVLDRLLADIQPLPVAQRTWMLEVIGGAFRHPCVLWAAEHRSGLPVLGAAFPEQPLALAGTEYRSATVVRAQRPGREGAAERLPVEVIDCPHAAQCALGPVCPREHYRVYADRFGLDEFEPVRVAELYGAAEERRA